MSTSVTKVYSTDNYKMFRALNAQRAVNQARVRKVMAGIEKVGQISPIIVNRNYEVIDGQARLEACRQLGIPVKYIIDKNLGIDECRSVNSTNTNWTVKDYIKSYSDSGNVSYTYLQQLIKRFGILGSQAVVSAIKGRKSTMRMVSDGSLVCDADRYQMAEKILQYEFLFKGILKETKGRTDLYMDSIGFCYVHPKIDNDLLYQNMLRYRADLIPVSTTEQALGVLEKVYNKKNRNKVYISSEYKAMLDKKMSWYDYRDFLLDQK